MQEQNHIGWAFYPDLVSIWAKSESVFSKYDCERIIQYGEDLNVKQAGVGGNQVKLEVRDSQVSWIAPSDPEAHWIFHRVTEASKALNDEFFKFDLWGLIEPLQFTKYVAPGGKYNRHVDRFNGGQVVRKLSFSVLLTDPSEYQGGDFEIFEGEKPQALEKRQGMMLAFPSFVLHAVTPVTEGTRHSLVGWIAGKPFK